MACGAHIHQGVKLTSSLPLRATRRVATSPRLFQEYARGDALFRFFTPWVTRRNDLAPIDSSYTCCWSRTVTTSQIWRTRDITRGCPPSPVPQSELENTEDSETVLEGILDKPLKTGPASSLNGLGRPSPDLATSEATAGYDRQHQGSVELVGRLKKTMRMVTQPVAIVTSTDPIPDLTPNSDVWWRGATVSSFNTVTLEPVPVVSFNIKKLSATFDAIERSGRFRVHFLSGHSSAIDLAQRFTKGHASSPFKGVTVSTVLSRNEPIDLNNLAPKDCTPPKIERLSRKPSEPVLFSLECKYISEKTVFIGDHVVVFGTVTMLDRTSNDTLSAERCLFYADGQYQNVGTLVEPVGTIPRAKYEAFLRRFLYSEETFCNGRAMIQVLGMNTPPTTRKLSFALQNSIRRTRKTFLAACSATLDKPKTAKSQGTLNAVSYFEIFLSQSHLMSNYWLERSPKTRSLLEDYLRSVTQSRLVADDLIMQLTYLTPTEWERPAAQLYSLRKAPTNDMSLALPYFETYFKVCVRALSTRDLPQLPQDEGRSKRVEALNQYNHAILEARTVLSEVRREVDLLHYGASSLLDDYLSDTLFAGRLDLPPRLWQGLPVPARVGLGRYTRSTNALLQSISDYLVLKGEGCRALRAPTLMNALRRPSWVGVIQPDTIIPPKRSWEPMNAVAERKAAARTAEEADTVAEVLGELDSLLKSNKQSSDPSQLDSVQVDSRHGDTSGSLRTTLAGEKFAGPKESVQSKKPTQNIQKPSKDKVEAGPIDGAFQELRQAMKILQQLQ